MLLEVAVPPEGATPSEIERDLRGHRPPPAGGAVLPPARTRTRSVSERHVLPRSRSAALPAPGAEARGGGGHGRRASPRASPADLVDTMRSQHGLRRACRASDRRGGADRGRRRDGAPARHRVARAAGAREPGRRRSSGAEVAREGCLSIPDLTANVRRRDGGRDRGAPTPGGEPADGRDRGLRGPLPPARDRPPRRDPVPGPRRLAEARRLPPEDATAERPESSLPSSAIGASAGSTRGPRAPRSARCGRRRPARPSSAGAIRPISVSTRSRLRS